MKIRNGFVTNSSSSSFVMAFKQEDMHNAENEKYAKLLNCVINSILETTSYCETDAAYVFSKVKEFKEYLKDNYTLKEETLEDALKVDEYLKKLYDKGVEYLNKGYKVAIKYVDYSDDATRNMIYAVSDINDDFVILMRDY